jgi:catechol 2,3-dioxygenase-like lactoylglutathione lyase family enzyme
VTIENIRINVSDISRSVDFYTRYLRAEVVGEPTKDDAVLDLVTATIDLKRVDGAQVSTWEADDLQKGFRHIGFKVAKVDPLADDLKAAGVPFHLLPLNAEGGVRITFFFDPDGTLLEFVEGDLQYHRIANERGVAAERALGVPERPRFDHVAVTVDDLAATQRFYSSFGFEHIGTINQPHDPRGFNINYLKGGDTVLEVFTYDSDKRERTPQLDAAGFANARLTATAAVQHGERVNKPADGSPVYADTDGFVYSVVD